MPTNTQPTTSTSKPWLSLTTVLGLSREEAKPPPPPNQAPEVQGPATTPKRRTFEELITLFRNEYLPLLKPNGALRYEISIKSLKRSFAGLTLDEITKQQIWNFVSMRREEGVASPTIRRDLACLSSMFEQAKAWEWLEVNLVRDMDFKHIKENPPRTRYLSKKEERDLLRYAVDYLRPMIIFAIESGFRLSEQMQLEWKQVDLEKREVTLIKTKTDCPRVVPLTDRALRILTRLPRHPTSPYVFCKEDGSPYKNLKKGLQGAARRAGIEGIRWHDLRRTCGCRLLQEYKVDLYLVRKWLGHKSVTMTERAYAFLEIDDLHDAIKDGPRFLRNGGEQA